MQRISILAFVLGLVLGFVAMVADAAPWVQGSEQGDVASQEAKDSLYPNPQGWDTADNAQKAAIRLNQTMDVTTQIADGAASYAAVNSRFMNLPRNWRNFDFAGIYTNLGVMFVAPETPARQVVTVFGTLPKRAVFFDRYNAILLDALRMRFEQITAPSIDMTTVDAAIAVAIATAIADKADQAALDAVSTSVTTVDSRVTALQDTSRGVVGDLTARLETLEARPVAKTATTAALDEAAVRTIAGDVTDTALKPVQADLEKTKDRQCDLEIGLVMIARALATNDPENTRGKATIRAKATLVVQGLGYELVAP